MKIRVELYKEFQGWATQDPAFRELETVFPVYRVRLNVSRESLLPRALLRSSWPLFYQVPITVCWDFSGYSSGSWLPSLSQPF